MGSGIYFTLTFDLRHNCLTGASILTFFLFWLRSDFSVFFLDGCLLEVVNRLTYDNKNTYKDITKKLWIDEQQKLNQKQ